MKNIIQIQPQKIDVVTEKNILNLSHHENDKWSKEDIFISYDKNGAIKVSAEDTKLKYVYLFWQCEFSDDTIILGDSWERGYGDLQWKQIADSDFNPWYCLVKDLDIIYGYGVKTRPNAFCAFKISQNEIVLRLDIRNGSEGLELQGQTLNIANVEFIQDKAASIEVAKKFCKRLCDHPRLIPTPIYGGNDWYTAYGNNSDDLILQHAQLISDLSEGLKHRPFMVVDDGWQKNHNNPLGYNGGPWDETNQRFKSMEALTLKMKEIGVRPGIWFRPLLTQKPVLQNMILRQNGTEIVLDPSNDDVLQLIKEDIDQIKKWGFQLIKHDFSTFDIFGSWGFEETFLNNRVIFFKKNLTTAQIIKQFYRAISEAAEGMCIIGCNTIGHLCAGFFEIHRGGDDTSGREWERTKKMGVNTLAFRGIQDKAFFHMDADCVGVTTQIPWEKNKQWLEAVALSGTPLFLSCEQEAITPEIFEDLKKAFQTTYHTQQQVIVIPNNWEQELTPKQWIFNQKKIEFDW